MVAFDKEEKKDDRVVVMMRPEGQAGGVVDATVASIGGPADGSQSELLASAPNDETIAAAAAVSKKEFDPLEDVDSALLSALCDARERKALFRLEQVMIDFMKDNSSASMQVGGALNSIVLKQESGVSASSSNIAGEAPDGKTTGAVSQGLQDLQYQQQRGLRQTSFQRLILHRLADRFNILREQINNNNFTNNSNERGLVDVGGQQHPSFSPGLIRLVKTAESCVPSNRLIDIDLSVLINYKNPRARNYGGGMNSNAAPFGGGMNNVNVVASPNNNGGYEDTTVRNLTQNMASTSLVTPPAERTASSSTAKKSSKKKMVIMKRASSGSDTNTEDKSKSKGKTRRKKLEDREKAYEEARARIFGIQEAAGNEATHNGNGENVESKGERSVPQSVAEAQDVAVGDGVTPLGSCHSSFSVENENGSPTSAAASPASSSGTGERMVPSQLISAASVPTENPSPPSPQQPQEQEPAASSPQAVVTEAETPRQASFASSNSSAPAAVTSGAISKAVYRNRQQEENDPDFKRRSDVRPAYAPYYGPPAGVNPYAMGQQQPPPPTPQMIAAMHAQQQAAAAAHQQPPAHFYHGQSHPNQAHQFPTPQDANFAGNVPGNAPPPQWAGPSRGYYPPSQQQGQQNQVKHPQSWQPQRTNSSSGQMQQQQQPNVGNGGQTNYGGQQPNAAPNIMNNVQPKQQQPQPTVLWGPGAAAARGDSNMSADGPGGSNSPAAAEGAPSKAGGKEGAAVYKPEDFPALR